MKPLTPPTGPPFEWSWQEMLSRASRGTILIRYYRCEAHDARCIVADEDAWQDLKDAIEAAGIKVTEEQLPAPQGPIDSYHRIREVIQAVFEVQGLKWSEGQDCFHALESLVAKYAKLK